MKLPNNRRDYLNQLYRRLLWRCHPDQARAVVTDCQTHFACGLAAGHTEADLCRELSHPAIRALTAELEQTGGRWGIWRGLLPRLLLSVVILTAAGVLRSMWNDSLQYRIFHGLAFPLAVFGLCLIWAPYLPPVQDGRSGLARIHSLIAAVTGGFYLFFVYVSLGLVFELVPVPNIPPQWVGPAVLFIARTFLVLLLALIGLALWRSAKRDRQFLTALCHGTGGFLAVYGIFIMLMVLDDPRAFLPNLLVAVSPYPVSLVAAAVLELVLRQGKRGKRELSLQTEDGGG